MSKQVKQTATYFLEVDGVASGPVTLAFIHEGIRNGELNEHDLIWKEGSKAKVELKSVQGLNESFEARLVDKAVANINQPVVNPSNLEQMQTVPPAINAGGLPEHDATNLLSNNGMSSHAAEPSRANAKGHPSDSSFVFCRTCAAEGRLEDDICYSCGCLLLSGNECCCCCGEATNPNAVHCVACNTNLAKFVGDIEGEIVRVRTPPIDPLLAFFCSLLVVGLGQFILGQRAKGLSQFLAFGVAVFLGGVFSQDFGVGVLALILIFVWILNAAEARSIGKCLQKKGKVKRFDYFNSND